MPSSLFSSKQRPNKSGYSYSGESSPEGGFPAVGNWRTRRAIPANVEQNDVRLEMPLFEGSFGINHERYFFSQ